MSQNVDILLANEHYTRADFTALRAYLNRIPVSKIAALYYTDDDLDLLGCQTDASLLRRIETLRDHLIQVAAETNPLLSEMLRNARRSCIWSAKLIDFLVQAADRESTAPRKQDPLSAWLKPRVASVFKDDQVRTLGDLISLIEVRGSGWWKPVRLIGPGKAQRIEAWLKQHPKTLGEICIDPQPVSQGELVVLSPGNPVMVPFERIALPLALNGENGLNRNRRFCQISARHDLDAIEAYLYKFRAQEKTRRAYQKELERFLLWCIYERSTALSSVMHEDCEAYKDFLTNVPAAWIGRKQARTATGWRPFAGQLSPASRKYAVQAVRFFFNWLVNVRYLGGNPWATVGDPPVATEINKLQIDKAIPDALWKKLAGKNGFLDQLSLTADHDLARRYRLRGSATSISMSAQFRLVRAAMLLMGDCGIRREELAFATRDKLKPIPDSHLWELAVLGKRNKWRNVFPPKRVIEALQSHWNDRGLDFAYGLLESPLISPLTAPQTKCSIDKHRNREGGLSDTGYSQDGVYKIIKKALGRIADDPSFEMDEVEREHLRRAAPHAFRHTFGTQAVAGDVPLDVVQKALGHASLQTTTLYVQAEKKRSVSELGKFFD